MKILIAASEAVPFSKTGGLADVAGALSVKLATLGHEVFLFTPRYRTIKDSLLDGAQPKEITVKLGAESQIGTLLVLPKKGVQVVLVDSPVFYDRPGLYGENGKDYPDNDRRFAFFARAVLEGAKTLNFKPDVIHSHDWQTGLIAALIKSPMSDAFFKNTATVFTIHNLAYQGNFPSESLQKCGIDPMLFNSEGLEYYRQLSFMKSGLVFSDNLNTVSPTYAKEIQESSERGFGFEGLLRSRSQDLFGILNGLDTDAWNPETDVLLAQKYSGKDYAKGKVASKKEIFSLGRLSVDLKTPLIGIVSRLDRQKGLDIALEALTNLIFHFAVVVIGTGDPALESAFADFAKKFPERVYLHPKFDEAFAHKVYAGSDLFLMPSRFEPCGLGQMIAMRYGSVPMGSRTGGLSDTIFEGTNDSRVANGFLCESGNPLSLKDTLERALKTYQDSSAWAKLVLSGMNGNYSWDKAAKDYLSLYEKAQKRRTGSK